MINILNLFFSFISIPFISPKRGFMNFQMEPYCFLSSYVVSFCTEYFLRTLTQSPILDGREYNW